MTLIPKDMTPVYKATIAKGTNAMRWQRAAYVDLLPPCNNACPAGLNIQAWLSLAQAGRHEKAWRKAPSAKRGRPPRRAWWPRVRLSGSDKRALGFTALDGLPMGTRLGQLDPGVILCLIERKE